MSSTIRIVLREKEGPYKTIKQHLHTSLHTLAQNKQIFALETYPLDRLISARWGEIPP